MNKEHESYLTIGRNIHGALESQMFGKPCFKINGKAFMSFFENEIVVKLNGEKHREALSLDGSKMFDPSGKNRPMKEWIQIPYDYQLQWDDFAKAAFTYVKESTK